MRKEKGSACADSFFCVDMSSKCFSFDYIICEIGIFSVNL